MSFKRFLAETINFNAREVIIPKGEVLYHGTIESNYGHRSIGFFKKAIQDLAIKQIRGQTHPDEKEWT